MLVDIYDGNNVMRRAYESDPILGTKPMSMRQRYEDQLSKLKGSQIWCWDGYQHNERRREIYSQYKTNRHPMGEDVFAQIKLWKQVLRHTDAHQFEVHGWEADDVAGTLARKLAAQGHQVVLHTNDMDYGQLCRNPNITTRGVNMKGVDPRWVCLYKATQGDSSDNIDGVPGFGPKRFEALKDFWPEIEQGIVSGHMPEHIPFTPAVRAWLTVPENMKTLQAMFQIVHLDTVPDDELDGGYTGGVANFSEGHKALTQFFL